ncbi:MAG TPA: hypothetical protein DEB70_00715 [Planctomycetaceae bacterium]|nr:hypothetical protein [Planctomycetaceae bacterium]
MTYALYLNVSGHLFHLQTTNGSGYQLQNVYSSGFDGNGETTGTYTWAVPLDAPNELFYPCELHTGMNGRIVISDLSSNGEQLIDTNKKLDWIGRNKGSRVGYG